MPDLAEFPLPREIIAYTLIGAMVLGGAIWGVIARRAYVRRKLRRQGIKRFGH